MKALKHWVESRPLRVKLMMFAGTACGLALVLAGVVLTIADYDARRRLLLERVQTQAEITARNSSAAVAFDDAPAATHILEAIGADRAIVAAEILREDGTLLARHGQRDAGAELIHVSAPVMLDGGLAQ